MGTYRTTPIDGSTGSAATRLLGINSLGQAAFLTRVCPPGHPSRAVLERFVKTPVDQREVAGLVEIAEDESGLYVVEAAEPTLPLQAVVARAHELNRPPPPELAAWLAMRLCQVCAALRQPHLRLSLRNVLVRPDGEPYLLGACWARTLPPDEEETPFVPPQPVDDAKADAYAAVLLARALAFGPEPFPAALKTALEAASGGPGWAWMLPSAEAAKALEQALGPEAASQGAARMAAWLRGLSLPAPASPGPTAPTLRLVPINRLNTSEEKVVDAANLPGGPAMSLDGRVEGKVGRASSGLPEAEMRQPRMQVSDGSEKLELDEAALAHAQNPNEAEQQARVKRVQAELAQVRRRRRLQFAVGALLVAAVLGALAFYLRGHPGQLDALVGNEQTTLLRVESNPPGAKVVIGGNELGDTPFICVNEYEGATVTVEKPGFEPATATIGKGSQTVKLLLKPKAGTRLVPPGYSAKLRQHPGRIIAPSPGPNQVMTPKARKALDEQLQAAPPPPETLPALEAGKTQVQKDQAEAAKKLGGTMDEDGQFVDPELAKEKRRR